MPQISSFTDTRIHNVASYGEEGSCSLDLCHWMPGLDAAVDVVQVWHGPGLKEDGGREGEYGFSELGVSRTR